MLSLTAYRVFETTRMKTGVIFPFLLQLQRGISDVDIRKQREICATKFRRGDEMNKGELYAIEIEREEECGICMEMDTKVVLPSYNHSLCMRCYGNWFHEFAEFTTEDIGTTESGLNSMVLANNDETVLLPLNEPVCATKSKSQIPTYLENNEGEAVQHLVLATEDIFRTLREMRKRCGIGGFEFMPSPPPTYYKHLKSRAGEILTDEQIHEC